MNLGVEVLFFNIPEEGNPRGGREPGRIAQ